MVSNSRALAVVCSTDLQRSPDFVEHNVGLRLSSAAIKNHLVFEGGGGTILLAHSRPAANKGDHDQVRFCSTDIAAA